MLLTSRCPPHRQLVHESCRQPMNSCCRRCQPEAERPAFGLMFSSSGCRYVYCGYSINTRYPSVGLAAQVRNIILNSVDPLPGLVTHLRQSGAPAAIVRSMHGTSKFTSVFIHRPATDVPDVILQVPRGLPPANSMLVRPLPWCQQRRLSGLLQALL
jgi:hypothetical protein